MDVTSSPVEVTTSGEVKVTTMIDAVSTAVAAHNDTDHGAETVSLDAELHMRIIYLVIGVVGICGNGLVMVVILNFASMRRTFPNMFIINQSMLDFTASFLIIGTTAIHDISWIGSQLGKELFCRLWLTNLPQWGIIVSSTYNLVFLTFERYFAIVHPMTHRRVVTRRKLYRIFAFVWFIGPTFNAAYMIPSSEMQGTDCSVYAVWPSPKWQRTVGIITVILQYFIPLTLITYAYVRIAYALKQACKNNHAEEGLGGKRSSEDIKREYRLNKARRNIFRTLALVGLAFVFCWSWNQIYFFMYDLGYDVDFNGSFYHFTVIAVFCNCCLNPFIYTFKYDHFQIGLRGLLCNDVTNLGESSFGAGTAKAYDDSTASGLQTVSTILPLEGAGSDNRMMPSKANRMMGEHVNGGQASPNDVTINHQPLSS